MQAKPQEIEPYPDDKERSLLWRLQDEDLQSAFLYQIISHLSFTSTCIQFKSMISFYRMGHSFPSRVTRRDNGAMPTIVLALHCIEKVANYSLFNFALMPSLAKSMQGRGLCLYRKRCAVRRVEMERNSAGARYNVSVAIHSLSAGMNMQEDVLAILRQWKVMLMVLEV